MIEQISASKNLDEDILIDAIEDALSSAAKKSHLGFGEMDIRLRYTDAGIEIYRVKEVVEEVENPDLQISLEDARKFGEDVEYGDLVEYDVDPKAFGRKAALTAKQVILQKIQDAERDIVYNEYKDKVGELVHGIIQHENRGIITVNLGKTEAIIPRDEQVSTEDYKPGQRIRAYIKKVTLDNKKLRIILSRTSKELVKKLFEMEVPEINDGIVEIIGIERAPGERTKLIVKSTDTNVDPVGTCVGVRGYRVQAVVRELSGEKIDIIEWTDDLTILIGQALTPASIEKIEIHKDEELARVIVSDDQLSLAIGRNGHNVRLASLLTGIKIDIKSRSEYEKIIEVDDKVDEMIVEQLTEVSGVGESLARELLKKGYKGVHSLAEADVEDLLDIKGVGEKKADDIIKDARKVAKNIDEDEIEKYREELLKKLEYEKDEEEDEEEEYLDEEDDIEEYEEDYEEEEFEDDEKEEDEEYYEDEEDIDEYEEGDDGYEDEEFEDDENEDEYENDEEEDE
jgi:N utilization substance protein A